MSRERARAVENALTSYTKNRVGHLRNNKPEPNFDPFKRAVNAYIQELLNTNKRPGFFNRFRRWNPPPGSPGAAANMNRNRKSRNIRNRWKSLVNKVSPPLPPKPKPNNNRPKPPPLPPKPKPNNNRPKPPPLPPKPKPPPLPPKPKPKPPPLPPKPKPNNNEPKPKPNNNGPKLNKNTRSGIQKMINARRRNFRMISNITGQKTRETGNWLKARGGNISRGTQGALKATGNWFGKAGTDLKGAWGEFGRGFQGYKGIKNNSRKLERQNAMKMKPIGMPSLLGRHGAAVSNREYKKAVSGGIQGRPPMRSISSNSAFSKYRSPPMRSISSNSAFSKYRK